MKPLTGLGFEAWKPLTPHSLISSGLGLKRPKSLTTQALHLLPVPCSLWVCTGAVSGALFVPSFRCVAQGLASKGCASRV